MVRSGVNHASERWRSAARVENPSPMDTFDRYELHARIFPVLWASTPVLLAVTITSDGALDGLAALVPVVVWVAVASATAELVAGIAHDREALAWRDDGGSPTVRALMRTDVEGQRHRDKIEHLFEIVVGSGDATSAQAAARALRVHARSGPNPNPAVAEANIAYGRIRQQLVLKPFALWTAGGIAAASAVHAIALLVSDSWPVGTPTVPSAVALALTAAIAALPWRLVTDERLTDQSQRYTNQLVGYLDSLPDPTSERN